MSKSVLAWHFLPADGCLGYNDGREVSVGSVFELAPGETPELCRRGFHGSVKIIDALSYHRGPIVCRVKISGEIIERDDKIVGSRREVLAMVDADKILHEFACWVAERALKRAKVTDEHSWNAIRVKRAWLSGNATDQELYHASIAAGLSAELAYAAGPAYAACLAAAAAADFAYATSYALRDATSEVVGAEATFVAKEKERQAQNRKLTSMVNKALKDAQDV